MKKQKMHTNKLLFGKKNYIYLIAGLILIALGFILMAGGGSNDPKVWNEAIFNFRRIRLAPMLILLGFIVEVYAIMLNPEK
jgi:sulfite exporter TauE/SafE